MVEALQSRPVRRTQAARTAATQNALMEATIAELVQEGYTGLKTASVARRAGVTRGAQAHHYGGKADLVMAAMHHLADRLTDEFTSRLPTSRRGSMRSLERVLDLLWELHQGELFTAAFELWIAARTDPELREALDGLESRILERIGAAAATQLPETFSRPGAAGALSTTMATMRGLAMLTFVHEDVEREWRVARAHLLQIWSGLV